MQRRSPGHRGDPRFLPGTCPPPPSSFSVWPSQMSGLRGAGLTGPLRGCTPSLGTSLLSQCPSSRKTTAALLCAAVPGALLSRPKPCRSPSLTGPAGTPTAACPSQPGWSLYVTFALGGASVGVCTCVWAHTPMCPHTHTHTWPHAHIHTRVHTGHGSERRHHSPPGIQSPAASVRRLRSNTVCLRTGTPRHRALRRELLGTLGALL